MKRRFLFLLLLLLSAHSLAIDKISLNIQQLFPIDLIKNNITSNKEMIINNLSAYILYPLTPKQQFVFEIDQIKMAQFKKADFSLKIMCPDFFLSENKAKCSSGSIEIKPINKPNLRILGNMSVDFNFRKNELGLNIKEFKTAGAKGKLSFRYNNGIWQLFIKQNSIDLSVINNWLALLQINVNEYNNLLKNSHGKINYNLKISGSESGWKDINISTNTKNLNIEGQFSESEVLTENLNFNLNLVLNKQQENKYPIYKFQIETSNLAGAVFIDPYYIELTGKENIALIGKTDIDNDLSIEQLNFKIKNIFSMQGKVSYDLLKNNISAYDLNIKTTDLKSIQSKYLNNLLAGTAIEGLQLSGQSSMNLTKQSKDINLSASFKNMNILFADQKIEKLNARIFWTDKLLTQQNKKFEVQKSQLSWDKIYYKQLEIGKTSLSFVTQNDQIKTNKAVTFPLFDGKLIVKNLQISDIFNDTTFVFDGLLEPVSLNQISQQLDWPILDGKISALIPRTSYSQKQLKLGGKLQLNVFDGSISFDKVVIEDPVSDYSRFNANIALKNISLLPLTQTFNFGKMEGRIEGYVNDLVLDNWQPSSFDLFIGTAKKDKSSHIISQRAVDNLSSMGGLPGVLSKGFMSFFENFHYDKLGLGCQLQNGRCKMRGVEEDKSRNAYYIVKGGGIPRIDIMGYENNVDWNTLIERLQSIQQSNQEAIIE